ncbi:hypothetical protein [Kordiimonas lacus]|uniref:Solute-binding protein family 3/N-terminal domain-containing protein n=1 Tax=Kordiimonas lacus TaxID=637679 RepID=A0A1G7ADH5_9PROT|nr:hypothetical protein [Kordiimonas lacus]SDE12743.1 conserved hypothetical protein [Kordiimonas lacus]
MRFIQMAVVAIAIASLFYIQPAMAGPGRDGEKPTIYWHFDHNPPVFIRRGPDTGAGVGDCILKYIENRLPDYHHVEVEAVLNRSIQEMVSRGDVCIAGVFKTAERQNLMAFTDPLFRLLPNRLIALREHEQTVHSFMDEGGAVDLPTFVRESGLMLGVTKDRAYSPAINGLVDDVSDEIAMVRVPHPGFAKLMARGRFDYTFGFPFEAAYQFAKLGQGDGYLSFPIKGEAKVMEGHFGCSDTPFGHEVVARVNAIARDDQTTHVFDQIFSPWLDLRTNHNQEQAGVKGD